jgi:hypothetical protein
MPAPVETVSSELVDTPAVTTAPNKDLCGHRDAGSSTPGSNDCLASAVLAPKDLVSPKPSDYPCPHRIHPSYISKYHHPWCPYCRLLTSIEELKVVEKNFTEKHGTVGSWLQRVNNIPDESKRYEAWKQWAMELRGGSPSRPTDAFADNYGKDWSIRHVKKRLQNVLDKVEDFAKQEARWAHESTAIDASTICRPATEAVEIYHRLRAEDMIDFLQTEDAEFARKRARAWEIMTDLNYPQDPPEFDHRCLVVTPEQCAFIKASPLPLAEQQEYFVRPRSRSRRLDAKVTFDPKIYVRAEADIDILRKQALAPSKGIRKLLSRLRALFAKPPVEVRDLFDAASCCSCFWRRSSFVYRHAKGCGCWRASEGSVIVDTSGYRSAENHGGWDQYVKELEEEAMGKILQISDWGLVSEVFLFLDISGRWYQYDYGSWEAYVKALEEEGMDRDAEKSDLRAAFEGFACFAIVWRVLFLLCTIAGPRQIATV